MSYFQGIGTLATGVALGVLATSTYLRLWYGRISLNESACLRFSPDTSAQTVRILDPNFAVCYDRRTRIPLWTIEYLTRETIKMGKNVDRGNAVFHEDKHIHPFFRSANQDYFGKQKLKASFFFRFSSIFKALASIVVISFHVLIIEVLKKA